MLGASTPFNVGDALQLQEVLMDLTQLDTEDLRTAMIHHRSLFEELVEVPTAEKIKEVA